MSTGCLNGQSLECLCLSVFLPTRLNCCSYILSLRRLTNSKRSDSMFWYFAPGSAMRGLAGRIPVTCLENGPQKRLKAQQRPRRAFNGVVGGAENARPSSRRVLTIAKSVRSIVYSTWLQFHSMRSGLTEWWGNIRCIPKMDHHCPWTANCVSHLTIPHFVRFVLYAVASMTYLEYFLHIRVASIWGNRHLPSVGHVLSHPEQECRADRHRSQVLGPIRRQIDTSLHSCCREFHHIVRLVNPSRPLNMVVGVQHHDHRRLGD